MTKKEIVIIDGEEREVEQRYTDEEGFECVILKKKVEPGIVPVQTWGSVFNNELCYIFPLRCDAEKHAKRVGGRIVLLHEVMEDAKEIYAIFDRDGDLFCPHDRLGVALSELRQKNRDGNYRPYKLLEMIAVREIEP